jgi:hypothetical protein
MKKIDNPFVERACASLEIEIQNAPLPFDAFTFFHGLSDASIQKIQLVLNTENQQNAIYLFSRLCSETYRKHEPREKGFPGVILQTFTRIVYNCLAPDPNIRHIDLLTGVFTSVK